MSIRFALPFVACLGCHAETPPAAPTAPVLTNAVWKEGLPPQEIKRVVLPHIDAIRACYDAEVARGTAFSGSVTARWEIDTSGAATSVSIAKTTLDNEAVESCVQREIGTWRFPASTTKTVVGGFPFKFGK